MKSLLTVLIICIAFSFSFAQPYPSWVNYTFSQMVTDIDVRGNEVWVSTQGGLVKYNKNTGEKTFYNRANSNLPDNNLLGVFCAKNGDVWVGGKYYGIGKLKNTECVIYNEANSGLPFNKLNSEIKLDNKGNMWIASFRSMVKYNGTEWRTWQTGSDISAWPLVSDFDITADGIVWLYSTDGIGKIEDEEYTIVSTIGSGLSAKTGFVKADSEGFIWIAIENEGIYKYDGTSFINFNKSNSCLPTNLIYAIDFDSENNMWLATAEGLIFFDTVKCSIFQLASIDKALFTLRCDENNTIWCGTISGKLLKFNGADFLSVELSNSPLKSNFTYPLFIERENYVWIGTRKNTVKTTSSGLKEVFNKEIPAGVQDKNEIIWLAFNRGDTCLLRINGDKSMVFDSLNSPLNTYSISITYISIDNLNNLWISTNEHGLFKYDGKIFTNYTTENSLLPSNNVLQTASDKNNNLWGGTANGLFKFDEANWTVWDTTNSAIPTSVVNRLAIDSENKIWFSCMDELRIVGGEYGGGLTCFDGQIMKSYNMKNSGLLANTIFGIYIDENEKIWLATYGAGLMNFDQNNTWNSYNVTNSGIANNITNGVTKDEKGNFWIGHNDAGISVFNPDSLNSSAIQINKFNKSVFVFPNPANDNLYVRLKDRKNIQAMICDLSGRLMYIFPAQEISQESSLIHFKLPYFLDGNQIYLLKIVCDAEQFGAKFFFDK